MCQEYSSTDFEQDFRRSTVLEQDFRRSTVPGYAIIIQELAAHLIRHSQRESYCSTTEKKISGIQAG
jgi:hypothetical protein